MNIAMLNNEYLFYKIRVSPSTIVIKKINQNILPLQLGVSKVVL